MHSPSSPVLTYLGVVVLVVVAARTQAQSVKPKITPRAAEAQRVSSLIREAFRVYTKEHPSLYVVSGATEDEQSRALARERAHAFSTAATALDAWASRYLQNTYFENDIETMRYVEDLFRIAVLREWADDSRVAYRAYMKARSLSLLYGAPYASGELAAIMDDRIDELRCGSGFGGYRQRVIATGVRIMRATADPLLLQPLAGHLTADNFKRDIFTTFVEKLSDEFIVRVDAQMAKYLADVDTPSILLHQVAPVTPREADESIGYRQLNPHNPCHPDPPRDVEPVNGPIIQQGVALATAAGLPVYAFAARGLVVFSLTSNAATARQLTDRLAARKLELELEYQRTEENGLLPSRIRPLIVYANLLTPITAGIANLTSTLFSGVAEPRDGIYMDGDKDTAMIHLGVSPRDSALLDARMTALLVKAMLTMTLPHAPMWFEQGLEAAYETADQSGPLDDYHLYYVLEAIRQGKCPTIGELTTLPNTAWSEKRLTLLRAVARYLVLYLRSMPDKFFGVLYADTKLAAVFRMYYLDELVMAFSAVLQGGKGRLDSVYGLERSTGQRVEELERGFKAFVASRDVSVVDKRWRSLHDQAKREIEALPALP